MNYSIAIRTLGKGGEKYSKLLKSIQNLKDRPDEVIVVLPFGYSPPKELLGDERFVYCEKGMMMQRIVGYESACSEYVLLVDDDVEFEPDFIRKVSMPIQEGKADITFPIYPDMLPRKGVRTLIPALTLSAVPMLRRDMYTKVIASGGWAYCGVPEQIDKPVQAHSAPGTCLYAKREALLKADLRKELWVELPKYALWDDMVMFYKAWLSGSKVMGVPNLIFEHLDAGGGNVNRSVEASYASGMNHVIFWYRFVYQQRKSSVAKLVAIAAFIYWMVTSSMYNLLNAIFRKKGKEFKAFINGLIDGYGFIKKKEPFSNVEKSLREL